MVKKFIAFATIIGLAFVATQFRSKDVPPASNGVSDSRKPTEATVPDFRAIVQPHLDEAVEKSVAAILTHLKSVDDFFDEAKKGSDKFAADVLGWGSKFRLVADHIPFTEKGRHDRFVKRSFEQHLFSSEELQKLIVQCVTGYAAEVDSIENNMLVAIRADVAEFSSEFPTGALETEALRSQFRIAHDRAVGATQSDLQGDASVLIASYIAQKLLARIAARLGASAAVLSVGSAGAPLSAGLSLLASIIVDQIVSYVWDWWANPAGELSRQIESKISDMQALVIKGDSKVDGLENRLIHLAESRAAARERVVGQLFAANK